MSNTNTNLQTQTSNALHNAIIEADGKDRPPMLAPGIDNDIYSTVDACPNAIWACSKGMSETKMGKGCNLSQGEDAIELEAHYLYIAKIQEVTINAADNSGPIFNTKPLKKVQNDNNNYNVFANDREHLENPEFVNDTYLEEQGDTNITIDSLDMSTNGETVNQDDDYFAKEREIEDFKNKNKSLESSNKTLIDKLKGEIEDFKNKNKSLESSNNHFKESNNNLSKTNHLMFKGLKKFQAELDRYHDVNYSSKIEINYAKAKGNLVAYKMESQKSLNEHTQKTNDLNQMISKMKKELVAHQETISIMSQE
nr:hypothetical protein [Tanacetum cinerariifolium]